MVRHNNQLPDNLPQLQNLIKRDPESYREEFLQQYKHFISLLDIFLLSPSVHNKNLDELVMFLAQVSVCYPSELVLFPQTVIDVLKSHGPVLDPTSRMILCRALVLLRNKKLLPVNELLELFFTLLRCPDKALREFLQSHIVSDIKNMNSKHKDAKVNSNLQNFMYSMLKDSNSKAAKMSVDIMIELYQKNVWNDSKTVNVIATTGCFSKITKVMVASLKFFLGKDPDEKGSDDSDSEDEPNLKEVVLANKINKKSRKREKQLENVKKQIVKSKKKKIKAPSFNFSALHLIHNPQGMAEGLFRQLEVANERFEVKLMTLDVISRLVGIHELFLFNLYPYIQRFIQPHQREVTRILQFVAQASHELLPPDTLQPVLKTIAYNFITERNSSDVIAIGINAIRETCSRCPLAMDEDLLRDLAGYKNYRVKSVMMAAKSLIHLYRESYPELLLRKDRGRPTEHSTTMVPLKYGEVIASDHVPGSEALIKVSKAVNKSEHKENSDDSDWVDVDSDEELDISESDLAESNDDDKDADDDDADDDDKDTDDDDKDADENKTLSNKNNSIASITKPELTPTEITAQTVSMTRIFTDDDFQKMEIALAKKKVMSRRKRSADELVSLADIENIYKKKKYEKDAKSTLVKDSKKDNEKYGYRDRRMNSNCSKTNSEKRKTKNYQMIKHKVKGKVKRSFKEKQISLKNHLIKQKRLK